ncbi:MAG: HPr family phosphocarrier protein [Spartobacteria bacterium]|nr:HPr family phosphocarrier protein [Spartobacteria bacterium]
MSDKVERKLKLTNKYGLHARPAALFVKTANHYQSDIIVCKDGIEVSGKSIMGLLTIEGYTGSTLTITIEGHDCNDAMAAITELFENKFYEE